MYPAVWEVPVRLCSLAVSLSRGNGLCWQRAHIFVANPEWTCRIGLMSRVSQDLTIPVIVHQHHPGNVTSDADHNNCDRFACVLYTPYAFSPSLSTNMERTAKRLVKEV